MIYSERRGEDWRGEERREEKESKPCHWGDRGLRPDYDDANDDVFFVPFSSYDMTENYNFLYCKYQRFQKEMFIFNACIIS